MCRFQCELKFLLPANKYLKKMFREFVCPGRTDVVGLTNTYVCSNAVEFSTRIGINKRLS